MDIYLIVLTGQGDTYVKPVDKETFDWVTSADEGRPKGQENDSGWDDQLVPESQKQKLKALTGSAVVQVTSGSFDNDRALAARAAGQYDIYCTLTDAFKAIKQHGDEVVDEYQGYIY